MDLVIENILSLLRKADENQLKVIYEFIIAYLK